MAWGDLKIQDESIKNFQWNKKLDDGVYPLEFNEIEGTEERNAFAVDTRDISLHYLYNLAQTDPTPEV